MISEIALSGEALAFLLNGGCALILLALLAGLVAKAAGASPDEARAVTLWWLHGGPFGQGR
jgi:hypothetical protein